MVFYKLKIICYRANLSDSSVISSSDEEFRENKFKKLKTYNVDDRATSKFYTKDESQEDLPYVANVLKSKKTKKKTYKKTSHSNSKKSLKVNYNLIGHCLLTSLKT